MTAAVGDDHFVGLGQFRNLVRPDIGMAEATEALGYAARKPTGKLRIGVPAAVGRTVIIPRLAEFEQRYPDIRLELSMCDYPYDLNEEGIDCAVRCSAGKGRTGRVRAIRAGGELASAAARRSRWCQA